jgi:hypothetical protein
MGAVPENYASESPIEPVDRRRDANSTEKDWSFTFAGGLSI